MSIYSYDKLVMLYIWNVFLNQIVDVFLKVIDSSDYVTVDQELRQLKTFMTSADLLDLLIAKGE